MRAPVLAWLGLKLLLMLGTRLQLLFVGLLFGLVMGDEPWLWISSSDGAHRGLVTCGLHVGVPGQLRAVPCLQHCLHECSVLWHRDQDCQVWC
jgi:hypothetical protein